MRVALVMTCLSSAALAEDTLPLPQGLPLPVNLGGPYELIDQYGEVRTEADPDGQYQLLFFGYANCQAICTVAFPLMAHVEANLADAGHTVTPVMITIDPRFDTVDTLGPALAFYSPTFVGLTGDESALQAAYDAYQIEVTEIFTDPEFGPVYAHGSFVYLLSPEGEMLTVLPPILDPDRVTEIVMAYLG